MASWSFGWSWRAIFWFNVFFGVLAFASAAVVLPESSDPVKARFDIPGFVLGALALGSLTFGIILGETAGYRTWWIVLLFLLSVAAALAFVVAELRAKNPVLNVRYFKKPAFASSNIIAFTAYFGTFAIFFMVALYLQVVVSVSPLGLALNFVPLAVGMVLGGLLTGRWVALWGPRIPMATGCLLAGIGILLTNAQISPHVGVGQIGWTMFIAGVGVGMAMVPVTSASLGSVPAKHSGMAASATNTFRELGAVVGVAVLGSIVNGQLTVNLVQEAHGHRHPEVVPIAGGLCRHHRRLSGRGQGGHGQEPCHHPHRQRGGVGRLRCLRARPQPLAQHRRRPPSGLGRPGRDHRLRAAHPPRAGQLRRGTPASRSAGRALGPESTRRITVTLSFSHLGICVSDLDRSLRFYCEGLGFEQIASHRVGEEFAALMELEGVRWSRA